MKRFNDNALESVKKERKKDTIKTINIKQYQRNSNYQKPKEMGCFCYNHKREFILDNSELRYYLPPKLGTNLSSGYDKFIERDENIKEHIDGLLNFIEQSNLPQTPNDIVVYRGVLTKILCTPYEHQQPWKIAITKFKGVYYIDELVLDSKYQSKTHKEKIMCYWGYKFESLSTVSQLSDKVLLDKEKEERINYTVNNNIQYCVVFRAKLGRHSLIFGAEVDCLKHEIDKKDCIENYIELKTSRKLETYKQKRNFEKFKLLKFWAQSFIPSIPRILVGFRDDDGVLLEVQEYKTLEIPRIVRGKEWEWDPNVCLNFMDDFFTWALPLVEFDDPKKVCLFEFNPQLKTISMELSACGGGFLTQSFIDSSK